MFVASYRNTMKGAERLAKAAAAQASISEYREITVRPVNSERHIERLAREAKEKREAAIKAAVELAEAYRQEQGRKNFRHSFHLIERRMCRVFGVRKQDLYSDRRTKEVVFARQAIMYWAARLTTRSLPEIGRLMGGRDHTTVLHGREAYPKKRRKMNRYLAPANGAGGQYV